MHGLLVPRGCQKKLFDLNWMRNKEIRVQRNIFNASINMCEQTVCSLGTNSLFALYKLEVRPIFSTPSYSLNTNVSIHLESINCNAANEIGCSLIGRGK